MSIFLEVPSVRYERKLINTTNIDFITLDKLKKDEKEPCINIYMMQTHLLGMCPMTYKVCNNHGSMYDLVRDYLIFTKY